MRRRQIIRFWHLRLMQRWIRYKSGKKNWTSLRMILVSTGKTLSSQILNHGIDNFKSWTYTAKKKRSKKSLHRKFCNYEAKNYGISAIQSSLCPMVFYIYSRSYARWIQIVCSVLIINFYQPMVTRSIGKTCSG